MRPYDTYRMELLVAFLVRVGLYGGIVAVLAIMFAACSPISPGSIFPSTEKILPPLALAPVDESGTRNGIPQDGGCHEKSDSSLRRPL